MGPFPFTERHHMGEFHGDDTEPIAEIMIRLLDRSETTVSSSVGN